MLSAQRADTFALLADAAVRGWTAESDRHRQLADRRDELITHGNVDTS